MDFCSYSQEVSAIQRSYFTTGMPGVQPHIYIHSALLQNSSRPETDKVTAPKIESSKDFLRY